MNKLLILALFTVFNALPAFAGPYIEGVFGNALGVRYGAVGYGLDASFGYTKTDELATISGELYRVFPLGEVALKLGGGLGYGVPDMEDRKADNGVAFVAGGSIEYPLTASWSIGGVVKGIFMTTKTRQTLYGSHEETLSNGQKVEVLDTFHAYDSERIDQFVLGLNLRYSF